MTMASQYDRNGFEKAEEIDRAEWGDSGKLPVLWVLAKEAQPSFAKDVASVRFAPAFDGESVNWDHIETKRFCFWSHSGAQPRIMQEPRPIPASRGA